MPIDYNIPLQVKSPQFQTPFELASQYETIQGQQGENQLTQRKLAAYDAADQQSNALAGLVKQNTDPATGKLNFAPVKAGMVGMGMGKEALEMEGSQAENELKILEQKGKLYEHVGRVLGGYVNLRPEQITPEINARYQQDAAGLHQLVGAKLDIPDQLDLPTLQVKFQQGMSAKDQNAARLDELRAQQSQFNSDRTYNRGVSEFEQTQANRAQTEGWYQAPGADGLPVWKQGKQEGAPVYSPTGISNKPMTEGQGKANIFGQRAAASHDVLNKLEETISVPGLSAKQAMGDGLAGAVGNTMLSPEQQQVEQAQRDFVNAALRLESGASIPPAEFENAKAQYFPQIGDSPEVIAQKRRNRETEIKGLTEMAGANAPVNQQPAKSAQPAAQGQITAVDPASGKRVRLNQQTNSWEPM